VVQVIRLGRLLYTESSKKPVNHTYRRPYAVAVLALSELINTGPISNSAEEREYSLKLYQMSDEKDYGLWQHELAAKKSANSSSSKFSLLSTGQLASGIVVGLRLLRGELAALRHEYIQLELKNLPLTQKLGHAAVIMPGDVR